MTDLCADRVALLAAINDLSPDVVFAKDRHGRMLYANPAALRLIGKPWAQVEGRTDAEFLDDPVAAATVMANDARIMASGRAEEIEEWVPAPDGSPRL